jgi:hypothetical protein
MDGQEVDFKSFSFVPGDVKGKKPFEDLNTYLPKGPLRLRIGRSSKALAMPLGTSGLSSDAPGIAKSVATTAFRKDPLGWLNYALARQRPLLVGEGSTRFIVLPRIDPRWQDEVASSTSDPPGGQQHDALASALLVLADRLVRLPGLAEDATGIRVAVTELRGDITALGGELKMLAGELTKAIIAMG